MFWSRWLSGQLSTRLASWMPGVLSQVSSARSPPRSPQPGVLGQGPKVFSQGFSAWNPQPGSARSPHPRVFNQESSTRSLLRPGVSAQSNVNAKLFGAAHWSHCSICIQRQLGSPCCYQTLVVLWVKASRMQTVSRWSSPKHQHWRSGWLIMPAEQTRS